LNGNCGEFPTAIALKRTLQEEILTRKKEEGAEAEKKSYNLFQAMT